jgi:hypothetical protein
LRLPSEGSPNQLRNPLSELSVSYLFETVEVLLEMHHKGRSEALLFAAAAIAEKSVVSLVDSSTSRC